MCSFDSAKACLAIFSNFNSDDGVKNWGKTLDDDNYTERLEEKKGKKQIIKHSTIIV